ncbi:hypothetical protein SCLCIDRAFT_34660 [Scleroderma citrinum Foug A]|uniref:Uncharacterized protein n=1 Tax=Scleroderma citrinum Foug A TaxID=1036808 RepID=A0A0C2YK31_9AGAM|nr:hypothetical protein SCLCIDRAFT_34660 [Scleroderma citrinum Foug A]
MKILQTRWEGPEKKQSSSTLVPSSKIAIDTNVTSNQIMKSPLPVVDEDISMTSPRPLETTKANMMEVDRPTRESGTTSRPIAPETTSEGESGTSSRPVAPERETPANQGESGTSGRSVMPERGTVVGKGI